MANKMLPILDSAAQDKLIGQIEILQLELENIRKDTQAFEAILRAQLSDSIIEVQELFILYKKIKRAKKAKRTAQKMRGKNYKTPKQLPITLKKKRKVILPENENEKKKLYKEAMLHVHPDKFYMSQEETEIATEITSRLIEIYQTEDLETLQAYHAHIFRGNTKISLGISASQIKINTEDTYLIKDKERIEEEIDQAKKHHIYTVLTEYDDPMDFVEELKVYYEDRIRKLKKRTRKGL